MKKLLILGANKETVNLINTAKAMGIYTLVTDPNPNAPAKEYADIGLNIDGTDVNSLVEFCLREKVDGVLVGVADRLITSYQQVCERLNLPCYGNKIACETLTDKGIFNELLIRSNLLSIPSIKLYRNEEIPDVIFPVFIKPVDKNSGIGMSIAYNTEELKKGINKAFEFTNSEFILLEELMDCNDVMLNFTIIKGKVLLSAMTDRFTSKTQGKGSRVCLGAKYPSHLQSMFMDKDFEKMSNLLQNLNLYNSVFTVSAFVKDGKFHYYDPGFRLQGEAPDLHIHQSTGFDQKAFLINNALGIEDTQIHSIFCSYNATVWVLGRPGKIGKASIYSEDPSIFLVSQRLGEGDTITEECTGTERQVVGRVYVSCSSEAKLREKIQEIQNKTYILDSNNNNLGLNEVFYE